MICLFAAVFLWLGSVLADREQLSENLIRLHVVANSDSEADQTLKLQIRDAVVEKLEAGLAGVADVDAAKEYLQENLDYIQQLVNQTLEKLGSSDRATVSLCREAFDIRYYDTFTLPAGVYEALRIVIGKGDGKNWWCVVFPSLCLPTTTEGFSDTAVAAGFSDSLRGAVTGDTKYQVRFYLLDALGELENILFSG